MSKRRAEAPQSGYAAPTGAAAAKAADEQSRLRLTKEGPENPDTKDFCGAFAQIGMDNAWDLGGFKRGFSIEMNHMSDERVEFDMIGIDPPLANAFRRILIAEVATVAISKVTMLQNTGVLHDENLCHRLGLIPIKFEPDNLKWRAQDAPFTEENSIAFTLHKVCDQDKLSIYSKDLVWKPLGDDQKEQYKDNPPRPVAEDILITQLRAGQEIEMELFCEKGLGKEHAKWSPVCTAFYRLLPDIRLTKPIEGEDADNLKKACPMGVFDIEELAGKPKRAIVANPRSCTTCRECIESFPGEEKGLELSKNKNHYIFSIESVGQVPAPLLFERALEKMKDKCEIAKGVLTHNEPKLSARA